MSEELNNSEQRIMIDKLEKDPRRVEAGKKLAAFNKMVRKGKDLPKEPEHHEESTCDKEWMSNTTKALLLAGAAAGLGYYIYTTANNSKTSQQPVTQNNDEVQENTVVDYVLLKIKI